MYEQMLPAKILGDSFAKTVSYDGIKSNFCLDIPEILEEERLKQERIDDIERFTKLAVSDVENLSHNAMVKDLFEQNNITDIFDDEVFASLSTNEQLLSDLGLL